MCLDLAEKIASLAKERGLRVAVVERTARLRSLLEVTLRELGFEVFGTDDAKQIVVMQFKEPFDLLLLRWDEGGAGKVVEAMTILCDELPKLIVISGREVASFSSSVPVSAFLFEPFTVETVIRAVWESIGEEHA